MSYDTSSILKSLRHTLSLSEIQIAVACAVGQPLHSMPIFECLDREFKDPRSVIHALNSQPRINVDHRALKSKMESLPLEELAVLQSAIGKLLEEYRLGIDTGSYRDIFGVKGLPCAHALRAAGLVTPTGKAAWGYYVVCLDDWKTSVEYVLRARAAGNLIEELSVQEHAERLANFAAIDRDDPSGASQFDAYRECFALARSSGLRFARVERTVDGKVSFHEITIRDLRSDLQTEDLPDLVLEGVNAPVSSDWNVGLS